MIKNFLNDDDPEPDVEGKSTDSGFRNDSTVISLFDKDETPRTSPVYEDSVAETTRRSGLAYSAGIAFFAAVVFMLILGWGADVLLGTRPWGIVFGIVIGSIIGFIQFFRISSQIFKK
ncbi:MAG TPA: AtpZ/AtpI family protein [Pyrinomonadaceae bacterium]|nr:AtpZ/AtpI family protein [Pyrinomonadaceae bacterium]